MYAVIGNPVHHSLSPRLHAEFARQMHQPLVYKALLSPLDQFEKTLVAFQAQGGKGANITAPFKQEAFALMGAVSERAQAAGAVNTVIFQEDGSRYGDNTDGIGLIRDFQHKKIGLTGKRILILGAGGAVRGILPELFKQQSACVNILNRSEKKDLFEKFSLLQPYQPGMTFDILINGLPRNVMPNFTPAFLSSETYCYDLSYDQGLTPFLQWAKTFGAVHLSDGLGMLVEQAAESFYLWHGFRPDSKKIF